jgi:hypothetical protein
VVKLRTVIADRNLPAVCTNLPAGLRCNPLGLARVTTARGASWLSGACTGAGAEAPTEFKTKQNQAMYTLKANGK